jgi:two-component system sensor histidine kinase UhpB
MKTSEHPLSILIIEDNPPELFLVEQMLRTSTINVAAIYSATRIVEATTVMEQHRIDLVLLDLTLPDSSGIDSFLKIKTQTQHIPVIILSGLADSKLVFEALQQGAQDYLVKGEFKSDLLARSVKYSIERKNAEEKILASEEKYRQMFYRNPFPACIYHSETLKILEVNDAAIEKYGYSRKDFVNLTINDIHPGAGMAGRRHAVLAGAGSYNYAGKVWKHYKQNGELILVELTCYQIEYRGQVAVQVQVNDVTEKHQLEEELWMEQKEKQQQITQAILQTQEQDRKMVGAELHDNINQILATAQLYLTAGVNEQADLKDMVRKGQECIVLAVREIRKLSKALVAPLFEATSLREAIESVTADIGWIMDLHIHTELGLLETINLTETHKLTIYRIVQEQMNNILKYAEATEVRIVVTRVENKLVLLIADNGKGFDPQSQHNGVGFINIHNRAELLNGRVLIDAAPGQGCRLQVELDIKNVEPQQAA